ncbi:hypothetical protein IW136_001843, partial [Coemansia sp. RSA 678]
DTSDVHIPSSFIARREYNGLRESALDADDHVLRVKLVRNEYYELPFLDVLFITILSPMMMMAFIYVLYRLRLRQHRLRDLAPADVVNSLPVSTFYHSKYKAGEPAECAICLDDFDDEDELRTLPCKHAYHVKCIDRWLTTRKKFCPICKQNVCPVSETSPLLSPRLRHGTPPPIERHPYNDDWGTTFVAILVMACIVFGVLAVLVRKSFRLVPTGVLALRTLVRGREDGHHVLPDGETGAEAQDNGAGDRSQLELLSDDDYDNDAEDARVIRVEPPM